MTRHDPRRTATVKGSSDSRSTAYRKTQTGPQAVSASALRKSEPAAPKRKARKFQENDVREWLYGDEKESMDSTFKYGLKSNKRYPLTPKHAARQKLAEEIARRLASLASRNRQLVQEGIMAYASNVQADNRMMLTPRTNERLLRTWMKFVRELEIEHLSVRHTAFIVAGQEGNSKSDLKEQCNRLGITKPMNVVWVKVANKRNPGALRNLAVDVVYKSRGCGVFRYVMAMAAISQPWPELVAPTEAIPEAPQQKNAINISEERCVICSECNTPLLASLPRRTGEGYDGESAESKGQLLIPVYLHFILNRPKLVWCCHFFEDDPKVSPKSIQAFPSAGSILGMAKRGRADDKAVGRQITMGSGGCWLRLTDEQYSNLLSRGRGDN
jgi:hypothetical protein